MMSMNEMYQAATPPTNANITRITHPSYIAR
jgi:hypothetical protein